MSIAEEKLSNSLKLLKRLQDKSGLAVVRTGELSPTHFARLTKAGFLREVMKGWYISASPESAAGDTTPWYVSYWRFVDKYLRTLYGNDWCICAEESLLLHSGAFAVPTQLIVRQYAKSSNRNIKLLHGTSIICYKATMPSQVVKSPEFGVNIYTLEEGLIIQNNSQGLDI